MFASRSKALELLSGRPEPRIGNGVGEDEWQAEMQIRRLSLSLFLSLAFRLCWRNFSPAHVPRSPDLSPIFSAASSLALARGA